MKKISFSTLLPALCFPAGVCLLTLVQGSLSGFAAAYEAAHPYAYGPSYAVKAVMVLLWAAFARALLAMLRRPYARGRLRVDRRAALSTCILLVFALAVLSSGSYALLLDQTFDIAFVFSALCIPAREPSAPAEGA